MKKPASGRKSRMRKGQMQAGRNGSGPAYRRLEVQYAVARVLAEAATVGEAMPKVMEAVCRSLDWAIGAFWLVDQGQDDLRCLEIWRLPEVEAAEFLHTTRSRRFPKGIGLPGRVWESGRPAWIVDVTKDANFPRSAAAATAGLHAAFAIPIVLEAHTLGVLEFFSTELRKPDANLLQAMAAAGNQLGQFFQRKRAEEELHRRFEQLQNIYWIVHAVTRAGSPGQVYEVGLDAISSSLKLDRVALLLYDPDGVMRLKAWRGLSGAYREATTGHSPWKRDDPDPTPVLVPDVLTEPSLESLRPIIDAEGIRALAFIPLLGQSRLIGKFILYYDSPHLFTDHEVQVAQTIASNVAFAIERKQAEEERERLLAQLRVERERMKTIVSDIPGIVWEAWGDPDAASQRIDFVSQYVEKMLGYSVEQWVSTPNFWLSIVHPEDRERAAVEAAAIYAGRSEGHSEFRWIARDGRVVWVVAQSTVIRDAEGNPIGMRGVTMDVTERKLAEEQQALLAEASVILSSSLDYVTTLTNIARLCAGRVSDLCSIDTVEGDTITRVAVAHVEPAKEEPFRRMEPSFRPAAGSSHPVMTAVESRKAALYPEVSDSVLVAGARNEEHLAALRGLGVRSAMIVPVVTGASVFGALTLVSTGQHRRYGRDDLVFAEELARRAGMAIENARRYEAEQQARRQAEEANEIVRGLHWLTEAALTERGLGELMRELVRRIHTILNADTSTILLLSDDGTTLTVHATTGLREEPELGFSLPVGVGFAGTIAETRRPLVREDISTLDVVSPVLKSKIASLMGVPLIAEGRLLGVLHVGSTERRRFTEEEVRLLELVGDRAAVSIDHVRLYEAEQSARREAEVAQRRQKFLADASAALASSLDFETTLASVAGLCVPYLGDWCSVDIAREDGSLHRVAVVHTDPARVELARQLEKRYPPDPNNPGVESILNGGGAQLYPEITDELLGESVHDPELLEILRGLGLKSAMNVPLAGRERTLGMITLVMAESGRKYAEADLHLAEELGRRAGLAVDNARLYSESQQIQDQLRLANEAKDEFLGLVSHELRTPITTVYGGARLLRSRGDKIDQESRDSVLSDIEHESERLYRIVEDLLVLARMELGQEVNTEPVLVQRVIDKAVAALLRRRPSRSFDVQVQPGLQPAAASPIYLDQVLRNLLSNADKYSPDDTPVEIRAGGGDSEIEICVRDHGPGIPPDEIELIFERFYRSDRTSKQAGGAGIGLTVCRRLIEAQGGRIWALNREEGGLEVCFSLPAYREEGPAAARR